IGLGVGELQRIEGGEIGEVLLVVGVVEQRLQPFGGADAKVVRALRTDVEGCFEILVVDELGTARTFHPEPLGNPAWFFGRGRSDWLPGLLEPGHLGSIKQEKNQTPKRKTQKLPAFAFSPMRGSVSGVFEFCVLILEFAKCGARSTACRGPCSGSA